MVNKNRLFIILSIVLLFGIGGALCAYDSSAQPVTSNTSKPQVPEKQAVSGISKGSELTGVCTKTKDLSHDQYCHPKHPPRLAAPHGVGNGQYRATFAGGCFWCMQKPFDQIKGVSAVVVGYTGGSTEAPSYRAVSAHQTDHVEAIDMIYDPKQVSYKELLERYWKEIDPTDDGGQYVDRGAQYRPVIYVHNDEQRNVAEESKKALQKRLKGQKVVVAIEAAKTFWPAEEYHQSYYKKNPEQYTRYHDNSGR